MDGEARRRYQQRVRALEAFGHRGSASANEARAADFFLRELTALGLDPAREPFFGCGSLGVRLLLHVVVAAIGAALLWHAPWLTVLLGIAALLSFVLEHTTRFALLGSVLLRRTSQNVVTRIPARGGQATRRIVVLGHYDTQRTGWIWREALLRRMTPVLTRSPGMMKSPLFLVLFAMCLQPLVGAAALVWPGVGWVSVLGSAILIVYFVSGCLLAQWAVGPYVPGACDNAGGSAAVISLAEAWLEDPIDGVELVVLLTGCEETGLLGAAAWADAHSDELRELPTTFLNLDSLGYGRPRFLGREHSLAAIPVRYPARTVELCAALASRRGMVDAGPHVLPVATDGLAFLQRGVPGASILSFEDGGHMPNYHQLSDTSDRMNFDVAWECVEFGWELLRTFGRDSNGA